VPNEQHITSNKLPQLVRLTCCVGICGHAAA